MEGAAGETGTAQTRAEALAQDVLGCPASEARRALEDAQRLGVEPLAHFATLPGYDDTLIMARAAGAARLPFSPQVPVDLHSGAALMRLDALEQARAVRLQSAAADQTYAALQFHEILALQTRPAPPEGLVAVTRRSVRAALVAAQSQPLLSESRQRLVRRWPRASASLDLSRALRVGFALGLLALVAVVALVPLLSRPLLLPFLFVFIVLPALFRLAAVLHRGVPGEPPPLSDAALPLYSILVPLRDEAQMVPQLAAALRGLDYPAAKLEVLFLVEEKSPATVAAVEAELGDARFELIVIPDAPPWTKPKALDYALPLVRGDHVVVFDAEDIPARDQLRLAASQFAAQPEVDCLQAELQIDNGAESWLTALFAGEYAGLFGQFLPWLAAHRLPLPLGGTSNHFRTAALREIGGWDAFNVTEDADLGLRLARVGAQVGTLRSVTGEEAPIRLGAWMRQRTRWIKGWMQTLLVHNRHPGDLLGELGWRDFLFVQVHVGSLIASSLIHSVFVLSLGLQLLVLGPSLFRLADIWDVLYLAVLIVGYGGAFGIAIAGLWRQGRLDLAVYQVLLPVYWLLHAVAAVRATIELLVRPYHWNKTRHGETRLNRQVAQR